MNERKDYEWLKQYWPECLILFSLSLFWVWFLTSLILQVVNHYSPVGGDSLHHPDCSCGKGGK